MEGGRFVDKNRQPASGRPVQSRVPSLGQGLSAPGGSQRRRASHGPSKRGGGARSPAAALIVTRVQLHRVRRAGAAVQHQPRFGAGSSRCKPPPAVTRPPSAGEGQLAPAFSGPAAGGRAPHRGSATAAGDQLLEEAKRRSLGWKGREGRGREEAANAADRLHTSLRLPWLAKEASGSPRAGRAGRGAAAGRAAEGGAAARAAAAAAVPA